MTKSTIALYDALAEHYLIIFKLQNPTGNIKKEADFINRIFKKYGVPQSIVDIGCGSGRLCGELAKRGYRTTGVDGSEKMLQLARTLHPKINFIKAKIEEFPVKADVGISWWTTYNYLNRRQFKQLAEQLYKNVSLTILDSSNYPTDKRASSSVTTIKEKGIVYTQHRSWHRKENKRVIKYTYTIQDGKKIRTINCTDISYWHTLSEMKMAFKGKFKLIAALGDYNLKRKYDANKSDRLISIWRRV